MNKKIFRAALVGCGTIAPNHLKALSTVPYVTVSALCDINPERAERMRAEYAPDAEIYTDYITMLDTEHPDSVHIATPHYLHCPMAVAALERGINVFLEKPMCITLDEIKLLTDAEKKSTGKVSVCFQNRYNVSTYKAMELVREDGGAVSGYASVFWDRGVQYYKDSDWRGSYATEGGGVMINQAIHTIDLLCQFLGKPERLWATKANHHLKGVIETEDTCEGMILFDSGCYGSFYATTAFRGCDSTSLFIKTSNHRIELRGRRLYVDDEPMPDEDTVHVGKVVYGNGHLTLITEFYDALKNGTVPPVSLESAQYALRVLLAAYRSNDEETLV